MEVAANDRGDQSAELLGQACACAGDDVSGTVVGHDMRGVNILADVFLFEAERAARKHGRDHEVADIVIE